MPDELKPHERAYIEGTIRALGIHETPPAPNRSSDIATADNPFLTTLAIDAGTDPQPLPSMFLELLDGTRVEHVRASGAWYFVMRSYERGGRIDSLVAVEALRALARFALKL